MRLEVSDEWIGTLLLAGLPNTYRPMLMGLESSGLAITADSVKTQLLQDVRLQDSGNVALYSRTPGAKRNKKNVRCYECNQKDQAVQKKKTLFVAMMNTIESADWYVDSGASTHMVSHNVLYNQHSSVPNNMEVTTANSSRLPIAAVGDVQLKLDGDNEVCISDVLYVPNLCANLLSVSKAVEKGNTVLFNNDGCKIFDADGDVVLTAKHVNGMFKLDQPKPIMNLMTGQSSSVNKCVLWHRRMGHLNYRSLKDLGIDDIENGCSSSEPQKCSTCVKGKQTRRPFKESNERASEKLELIHSDLCGPIECLSLGGGYILTFVDDFSRRVYVYI